MFLRDYIAHREAICKTLTVMCIRITDVDVNKLTSEEIIMSRHPIIIG